MSFNTFGKIFRFTTWGESHGPAIGCVVDGCPPNVNISEKGEMTVVVSENLNLQNRLQVIEESVKKKIIKLLKKMSIKDITLKISKENNISKKIIYDFCLKKKNEI